MSRNRRSMGWNLCSKALLSVRIKWHGIIGIDRLWIISSTKVQQSVIDITMKHLTKILPDSGWQGWNNKHADRDFVGCVPPHTPYVFFRMDARGVFSGFLGIMRINRLPFLPSLSTWMNPWWASRASLQKVSPSPVEYLLPSLFLVIWKNLLKMASWNSGAMPGPLSCT